MSSIPQCISSLLQSAQHRVDAMLDTEKNSQRALWPRKDGDNHEWDSGGKEAKRPGDQIRKLWGREKGASFWRCGTQPEGMAQGRC